MIKEFADVLAQAGVSSVLKERLGLASDKHEAVLAKLEESENQIQDLKKELDAAHAKLYRLEKEIEELRESTASIDLPKDAQRALRILFEREIAAEELAHLLEITSGKSQHYLDLLDECEFALVGSIGPAGVFWNITPDGRKHVVNVIGEAEY